MKTISISQLEIQDEKGAVWVLNSAATSEFEIQGDIIVNVPHPNGKDNDSLKIPQTWLPVNIADEFPRSRLLNSIEFRKAVNNGLLKIVPAEVALAMLKQEGASEERNRLAEQKRSIRQAGAARTISQSNVEMTRADGVKDDDDDGKVEIFGSEDLENLGRSAARGVDLSPDGYKPSFIMFVDKIKGEKDIEALNAIRSRAKFTRKELKFMRDTLPNHPKTVAALKDRIKASVAAAKSKTGVAA